MYAYALAAPAMYSTAKWSGLGEGRRAGNRAG